MLHFGNLLGMILLIKDNVKPAIPGLSGVKCNILQTAFADGFQSIVAVGNSIKTNLVTVLELCFLGFSVLLWIQVLTFGFVGFLI